MTSSTQHQQRRVPLIVAHRGASGLEPENTLRSYQRAIDLGADCIELDVHKTKDGELVLAHDPHIVDYNTKQSYRIAECTLEEIKTKIDLNGRGERVPTFTEALRLIKGVKRGNSHNNLLVHTPSIINLPGDFASHVLAVVELKDREAVPEIVATALREDMLPLCVFCCFVPEWLEYLISEVVIKQQQQQQQQDKQQPVVQQPCNCFMITGRIPSDEQMRQMVEDRGKYHGAIRGFGLHWASGVTQQVIDRAHELGLVVGVGEVDDPAEIKKRIEIGVDFIVTNRPDTMRSVIEELTSPDSS